MGLVVILGGGESGYGAAALAKKQGYAVWLSDAGTLREPYRTQLVELCVDFEEGGHTLDKILEAELVIKSPGIPDTAPVVRAIRDRGIPVISEIEFAGRYMGPGVRTVCITGSNGKTTTTSLICEMMQAAGLDARLAGNIGQSLALQVADPQERGQPDWYVIELSSFQLDGMFDFRADVALLLNVTPDHLDRYDHQMERYVASKFRVARNQRLERGGQFEGGDTFIYNADDPQTVKWLQQQEPELMRLGTPFSVSGDERKGAWYDPESGVMHAGNFELSAAQMRLKGLHNIANALAAVLAARAAGVGNEELQHTLRSFGGVEHRMEPAGTIAGVEYINDSKATNVDSAWYALQAMTRPTIWIAGGTDKGNDYAPLVPLARKHVKALICMGLDNRKLVESFRGVVPVVRDTASLAEAMAAVQELAQAGDVVLLSPACASFDLFKNYEDRGRQFKAAITCS